jgi:preprotein translocase subunit SecG
LEVYFSIALIIISIVLIGLVLLQTRGGGMGSIFGGESTVFHTRRGVEKTVFNMTVLFSILFLTISLLTFLLSSP